MGPTVWGGGVGSGSVTELVRGAVGRYCSVGEGGGSGVAMVVVECGVVDANQVIYIYIL